MHRVVVLGSFRLWFRFGGNLTYHSVLMAKNPAVFKLPRLA